MRIWWSRLAFSKMFSYNIHRDPQSNDFGNVELNKERFLYWRISQSFLNARIYCKPPCRARNAVFSNISPHAHFCSESQGTSGIYIEKYWSLNYTSTIPYYLCSEKITIFVFQLSKFKNSIEFSVYFTRIENCQKLLS